jgi:2-polyprenyl-6-methoxyphenol hydroxylase-like FAD-dependent oxidoreductase
MSVPERAVVVGGSIGGLLAARVLADHFREVVIVDRDRFPEQPEFRAGVPQARHAHALLDRGRRIISTLLPGIEQEMLAAGGRLYDVARDFSFVTWAGDAVRFEGGIPWLAVSRQFLEHHVRRRVLALPNVTARTGVRLTGLEGTARQVTGVRALDGETISSELVVDAAGRESKCPEWLVALGAAAPAETVVKPFLGYSSRTYQAPERDVWDRVAMIALALPPSYTRGVSVVPVEHGHFTVTLIGMNGDFPPTEEAPFREFARSLPVPEFHAWIDAARPVGEIHGFRFEKNRLRHFEKCQMPAGLVALGDSVASFNPVYGQGMTSAAIGAEVLADVLARRPAADALPRVFHRRLAKLLQEPWAATTTEDLRYPGTEGKRTFAHRIAYAYMDRLFVRASKDESVRRALIEVFGMTKSSSHLFRLPLVLRALTTSIPRDMVRPQHALQRSRAAPAD